MKLAVVFFLIFVLCLSVISTNDAFGQSTKTKQVIAKKCVGNAYDGTNLKLFEFKSGAIDKTMLSAMDDCLSAGYKIHPFQIFRTNDSSVYVLLEKTIK